jgi:predicted O-linked N-acetylglucosamine transferase (SPINDLY family)
MQPTSAANQPPIPALVNLLQTGQFDLLIKQARECASRWPNAAPVWHLMALAQLSAGRPGEAVMPLTKAARLLPKDTEIQEQLAVALMQSGRSKEALRAFERCLELAPNHLGAMINAASLANDLGAHDTALKYCQKARQLAPQQPEALFNQARAQAGLGLTQTAISSFLAVAAATQTASLAQNDIGLRLFELGAISDAETCLRRAIALTPDNALAHANLGKVLEIQGKLDLALASLRQATRLNPQLAGAFANMGGLLNSQRQFKAAEEACRRAVALEPKLAGALTNLANALLGQQRHAEAEALYRDVLAAEKMNGDALNNLGNLLLDQKRFGEAEACYRKIRDDHGYALGQAFHCASHLCDWQRRTQDATALRERLRRDDTYCDPFGLLTLTGDDAPEIQRRSSWLAARNQFDPLLDQQPMVSPAHHPVRDRLRIGYLSADLHDHATMHLLAGVLQAHDRDRYAIHLYSYGPDCQDSYRKLAMENCEAFHDLRTLSDHAAARQIADDGIDILLDLKGYTRDSRLAISALRPSPVIVSWLGYPGTLGHERLADYIIGDPTVTPLDAANAYSETLALIPHCYQPNDRSRPISAAPPRVTEGLPENAFVFCSFNQSYKIIPEVFDIWCKLLSAVPGSVLWLLESPQGAMDNLRREARVRNIDPQRIIFAGRKPLADHLGRLQLADLALDTFPYGSHTTGSDALWAGVPLITRPGNTFASRVAASLLSAAGLPELITDTWEAYFALALELANDSVQRQDIRQRLASQRLCSPLFDTQQFTTDLERLYERIWAQHATGERKTIAFPDDA